MKREEKELILKWFKHIEQIADDRKTANGHVMTSEDALAEIKVLARDAAQCLNLLSTREDKEPIFRHLC